MILQFSRCLCRSEPWLHAHFLYRNEWQCTGGKNPHIITKHLGHELRTAVKNCHVTDSSFNSSFYAIKSATKHLWVQLTSMLESEYRRGISPLLEFWSHVRKKNVIIIMLFSSLGKGSAVSGKLVRCLSWEQKDAAFSIKRIRRNSWIIIML